MLPPGWETKVSRSTGKEYYFNSKTGESTYTMPTDDPKVRCRHILRKHAGSRRPASWRNPNITQSKDESIKQIEEYRLRIQAAFDSGGFAAADEEFQKIAQTESDCSSAERGGDLGVFGKGQMQRAFEEASFALEVGGLSGIVDSDSGIHIILRIA